MSREPGTPPQFNRLISNLERAKALWADGNHEAAERLLKLVGSIAMAECEERRPNDPRPESFSNGQTGETK